MTSPLEDLQRKVWPWIEDAVAAYAAGKIPNPDLTSMQLEAVKRSYIEGFLERAGNVTARTTIQASALSTASASSTAAATTTICRVTFFARLFLIRCHALKLSKSGFLAYDS